MSWELFGRRDEVSPEKGLARRVAGKPIVVYLVEGKFYAIHDQCPHAGAPLSDGSAYIDEIDGAPVVLCPLHYWVFSLENGQCMYAPSMQAAVYDVELRGEEIWIRTEARKPA